MTEICCNGMIVQDMHGVQHKKLSNQVLCPLQTVRKEYMVLMHIKRYYSSRILICQPLRMHMRSFGLNGILKTTMTMSYSRSAPMVKHGIIFVVNNPN